MTQAPKDALEDVSEGAYAFSSQLAVAFAAANGTRSIKWLDISVIMVAIIVDAGISNTGCTLLQSRGQVPFQPPYDTSDMSASGSKCADHILLISIALLWKPQTPIACISLSSSNAVDLRLPGIVMQQSCALACYCVQKVRYCPGFKSCSKCSGTSEQRAATCQPPSAGNLE
jgi:hypothetical protein